MSGGDWIKVHRRLLAHPTMQHDGLCRLWLFCLMRANWKEATWLIPGTMRAIKVARGQFITGRESLYSSLYGDEYRGDVRPVSRTLWRWLQTLSDLGCVSLQNVSNHCTLVTVCNYEAYQNFDEPPCPTDVQPVSSLCPTDVQPVSTIEELQELKEGEEVNKISAAKPPRTKPECSEELLDWVRWWNGLHERGLVHAGLSENPLSKGVVSGWGKVRKSKELQGLLSDRSKIEDEIRRSNLAQCTWWSLSAMFGTTSKDGEYKVATLLRGGYRFLGKQQSLLESPRVGAGQRYQPDE